MRSHLRRAMGFPWPQLAVLLVLVLAPSGAAADIALLREAPADPLSAAPSTTEEEGPGGLPGLSVASETLELVRHTVEKTELFGEDRDADAAPPPAESPGFAESVRAAVADQLALYSTLGGLAALASVAGFALVTRRLTPREALKNPQRAMIYGFIRATPGAHLKMLSEEFGMKSSSILWHVRKLEAADLVRSQRANGYRVFHPVAGGQELRRLSRGVTALHNPNARRTMERIHAAPGSPVQDIAEATGIHPGTVRWHLRKLRDFGLVEESEGVPSRFFVTPLGARTLETAGGEVPSLPRAPVPHPESA